MSTISDYAWEVAEGRRRAPNIGRGMCLSNAQRIASAALGYSIYSRWSSGWDFSYSSPTAATAESAWISKGLAVRNLLPGDLIFNAGDSRAGHVAIYLGIRNGVAAILENTYASRGKIVGGQQYIRLTSLADFGPIRTIIRFPEDVKTAADKNSSSSGGQVDVPLPVADPTVPPTPGVVSGDAGNPKGVPIALPSVIQRLITLPSAVSPDSPSYRRDEDWMFHTIHPYEDRVPNVVRTNIGMVSGIVILRSPFAVEMQHAFPFAGPFLIAAKNFLQVSNERWNVLKQRYYATEAWGTFYRPLYEYSTSAQGNKNQLTYPLPGVTSVVVRQNADGNSVAEVFLQIDSADHAEMVLASVTNASTLRSMFAEIWLPVSYYDPDGEHGERSILYPVHIGLIEEVVSDPWPHGISFRITPQDRDIQRGMSNSDGPTSWPAGTTLAKIVLDVAKANKIGIFTTSALPTPDDISGISQLKQFQAKVNVEYHTLFREPMDIIRNLVEMTAGLQLRHMIGLELLGRTIGPYRSIWIIVDPLASNPLTGNYWRNAFFVNVLSKILGFITGNDNLVGELTVIYPHAIGDDPKYIKRMAQTLDLYAPEEARAKPLRQFIDKVAIILEAFNVGSGPAVKSAYQGEIKTALIDYIEAAYSNEGERAPVQKYFAPAITVGEFRATTPTASQAANSPYNTGSGGDHEYGRKLSAAEAAKVLEVEKNKDGSYDLATPYGVQNFKRKDDVYLQFSSNLSRPSMVVSGNLTDSKKGMAQFQPFSVSFKVKPTHGVRIGGLAVVVGCGRLDGLWTINSIEHTLTGTMQELVVGLVTARSLYNS